MYISLSPKRGDTSHYRYYVPADGEIGEPCAGLWELRDDLPHFLAAFSMGGHAAVMELNRAQAPVTTKKVT